MYFTHVFRIKFFFLLMFPLPILGQVSTESDNVDYIKMAESVYLQSLDSALFFLHKGVEHYGENGNNEEYLNCLNGIGTCLYYKGEYLEAFEYFNVAIDKTDQLLGQDNDSYPIALNNLSRLQSDIGEYDQAIKNYRKAAQLEEQNGNMGALATVYNNLGNSLEKRGDIQEAISFHKKALSIQKNLPNPKMIKFASRYHMLASALLKQNDLEAAYDSQEKALAYYQKSKDAKGEFVRGRIIDSYWNLVEISMNLDNDSTVNVYSQKAVQLEKEYFSAISSRGLSLLGEIELNNKNIGKAITYFLNKLAIQKKQFQGFTQHPKLGETYAQLANAYFELDELSKSLDYYHQALNHVSKNFQSSNVFDHPSFDSINKDQETLKILFFKAQAFCKLADDSNDKRSQYLDAAEQTFDIAIQLINHLRKDLQSQDSKVLLGEMANLIYRDAVKCNYVQYLQKPTKSQLEKIFQLIESGKAAILLESINENTAKGFAGIPDSLIEKDNQLKKEISKFQELLYNLEKSDKLNDIQIEYVEGKLFEVKSNHTDFLTYLESNYPNYYNLKYDQRLVSLDHIKEQLPDSNTAIIEYFIGENELYVLYVSRESSEIVSVTLDGNLKKEVTNLRNLLHKPPNHEKAKEDFIGFNRSTHYIYEKLIGPIDISESINRLIIIPDDILGYVPFEVLITQPSEKDIPLYNSKSLNYLINDYAISYNYSVTLWAQESVSSEGRGYLGVAPNFDILNNDNLDPNVNLEQNLYRLKCNEKEISSVAKIIPGLTLTGNAATKEKILNYASQYQILHFATHSSIDDENPMLNKIFLSNDYLSNYDLYNIQLKADLAVLSACNTGNGRLLSGEGVMSIFRGFLHAGCPSSLISLWSVEDCSTQAIIQDYFEELANGQPKDIALQSAKKKFVQNADRLHAHPFYWAAFVQFGSIDKIEFNQVDSTFSLYNSIFIGLVLLSLGFCLWYIRSKS